MITPDKKYIINSNSIILNGYDKLSDILVPLSIIENQIKGIEGIEDFSFMILDATKTKHLNADMFYSTPYPYISPVKDNFNEPITNNERAQIIKRVNKYFNTPIPKKIVNEFDNDLNTGAIININSGSIQFYNLSSTEHLEAITIPHALPSFLYTICNIYKDHNNGMIYKMFTGIEDDNSDEEDDYYDIKSEGVKAYVSSAILNAYNEMQKYEYVLVYRAYGKEYETLMYMGEKIDDLHSLEESLSIHNNTLKLYNVKKKVILIS